MYRIEIWNWGNESVAISSFGQRPVNSFDAIVYQVVCLVDSIVKVHSFYKSLWTSDDESVVECGSLQSTRETNDRGSNLWLLILVFGVNFTTCTSHSHHSLSGSSLHVSYGLFSRNKVILLYTCDIFTLSCRENWKRNGPYISNLWN